MALRRITNQVWILWAVAVLVERPILRGGVQTGIQSAASSATVRAYDEQSARVLADEYARQEFPPTDGYTNHKISLSLVPAEWYKAKA